MEKTKDIKESGTMEQVEKSESSVVKDTISLSQIIKEMVKKEGYDKSYERKIEENMIRKCERRFIASLEKLVGFDAAKYLKVKTRYLIPVKSSKFVKKLMEPDETLEKFLKKEFVLKEIGIFEEIDMDDPRIENNCQYEKYMRKMKNKLEKLFSNCDDKKKKEVMKGFYREYNNYYKKIENGLESLQVAIESISQEP